MFVFVVSLFFASIANCAIPNSYSSYLRRHDVESIIEKEIGIKAETIINVMRLENQKNVQYLEDVMAIKKVQLQDYIRFQSSRVIDDLKSILMHQTLILEDISQRLDDVSASLRQECVLTQSIDKKEIINLMKQKKLKMMLTPPIRLENVVQTSTEGRQKETLTEAVQTSTEGRQKETLTEAVQTSTEGRQKETSTRSSTRTFPTLDPRFHAQLKVLFS